MHSVIITLILTTKISYSRLKSKIQKKIQRQDTLPTFLLRIKELKMSEERDWHMTVWPICRYGFLMIGRWGHERSFKTPILPLRQETFPLTSSTPLPDF